MIGCEGLRDFTVKLCCAPWLELPPNGGGMTIGWLVASSMIRRCPEVASRHPSPSMLL